MSLHSVEYNPFIKSQIASHNPRFHLTCECNKEEIDNDDDQTLETDGEREEFTQVCNIRLPGKENSSSHGARPVHVIIKMMKWIGISRSPIKNSLSL